MGHSGQLGYINALCDLINYRKYEGVTSQVFQNFSVVEMLLRKARKCVSKKMRTQWNSELDIESLEKRGHWATLENLQDVSQSISFGTLQDYARKLSRKLQVDR